jgi:predicted ester cyclase
MGETREHFPNLHAAFPDLRHTIETEIVNGEMVAAVVYLEGTHLGPYRGVAPTSRKVRYRILMFDRIINGKVVLHHAAPDFLGAFAQLGTPLRPASTGSEARP